jgi:cell wall-associated NlpC family hydrolase
MVASFALPASAARQTVEVKAAALPVTATHVTAALAVTTAIAAPSAAEAPLASRSFGKIDFSGVDKPAPVAAPVSVTRVADRASRSTTRVSPSDVAQPAPEVAPAPASGGALGIAASLQGIFYVYGGTTPAGFDCSGFTQYIFAKLGKSLPRTAEDQRQATTSVSNPQPGDLVFFGAPAHHMGIYAGNGMMWDSPRSGKTTGLHSIYSPDVTYGRVG